MTNPFANGNLNDMKDINPILAILSYRKRTDLVKALRYVNYELDISNTYGSALYSTLTTVQIFAPLHIFEKLICLKKSDNIEIINAFHIIYPIQEGAPEITNIEYLVDPNAPLPKISEIGNRNLTEIDFDYIGDQLEKSDEKLLSGDYEGAITNARNLLESICKYILDSKRINYKESEDLPKLYKLVSKSLNMDPSQYEDVMLKEILSGCFSIINGISNVRNEFSDAHGKSKLKYYKPKERHSKLVVNIAKSLSEYLYSAFLSSHQNT